jgi:Sec-independent protein translocase protein TatA
MTAEFFLILLVAVLAFGPKKLPMLAAHLGLVMRQIDHHKNQVALIWRQQIQQLQLEENQIRAEEADKQYKERT